MLSPSNDSRLNDLAEQVADAVFVRLMQWFRLGLIVPDARWKSASEWEAAHREVTDKYGPGQPTDGRTVTSIGKAADA